MKIILTQDVDRVGKAGELIKVKDGFARNFLVPKGWAIAATAGNRNAVSSILAGRKKQAGLLLARAQELAARIDAARCTLTVSVGEQGKLHGAVTSADLSKWLADNGISLAKHQVHLESPLVKLGEHEVSIKLHPEITATLRVTLIKK